ncbi:hypothetical protein [Pseudoduganella chitinolytica]|uniref:CHRD domain-containing protein n=1 Tax=Pseudoduganella chitinolytica TaxID=34070 RepID=A0ABY8BG27_9BURK|nr:hypothetical protein [Pseudoduganella chitinolytica]WEF34859.1 hypothetical protein PX653_08885 [Pseudoduganella chitinolytica]
MAAAQSYASSPRFATGKLSAANTARDGTGTIVTVFTAGGAGSRIESINIQATGPTTQGMVRLFVHDGTNSNLVGEVPVSPVTPSGTQPAFGVRLTTANLSDLLPLILPAGHSLRAAPNNAETFNVIAVGGDF